ncbi:MFS transporter, partial [Pseudomonas ogarae]
FDHPAWLFPLYALSGLLVGTIGAVPYVMVNAFPAVVRFSGLSFSYNLAYAIFGGLTPMVLAGRGKERGGGGEEEGEERGGIGIVVGGYLWKKGR